MTTLLARKSNLTTSLGFIVLVVAAVAVSLFARDKAVPGTVFAVIAVGLVVLTIVLHRQPANELNVSEESIELKRPGGRVIGRIDRTESGGQVELVRRLNGGRTMWSLAAVGSNVESWLPIDDYTPDEIRAAAEQHGWTVSTFE